LRAVVAKNTGVSAGVLAIVISAGMMTVIN